MESNHGVVSVLLMIASVLMILSSSSSYAYKFNVGGKDGWVVKPSEDYDHWAQRNRFQVNDTLYFRYKKGSDSVVVVNEEDYRSCTPKHSIQKMEDGNSAFVFDRSGPFFFISGNVENCKHGQKLIVVVLALTHHHNPTQPSSPPLTAPPPQAQAKSPADSRSSGNPSAAPTVSDSPAPSPKHSGSLRIHGSVVVALAVSVGLVLFFSRFA